MLAIREKSFVVTPSPRRYANSGAQKVFEVGVFSFLTSLESWLIQFGKLHSNRIQSFKVLMHRCRYDLKSMWPAHCAVCSAERDQHHQYHCAPFIILTCLQLSICENVFDTVRCSRDREPVECKNTACAHSRTAQIGGSDSEDTLWFLSVIGAAAEVNRFNFNKTFTIRKAKVYIVKPSGMLESKT